MILANYPECLSYCSGRKKQCHTCAAYNFGKAESNLTLSSSNLTFFLLQDVMMDLIEQN